jgi:hypothetical protein
MGSLEEGDGLWWTRFRELVDRYLASDGESPEAGAAAFTDLIGLEVRHQGPGEYDIEGPLWSAWLAVIAAADTPDDSVRARLVALLLAIRDRGMGARADGQHYIVWGQRVTGPGLPVFGAQMREVWNDSPPDMPAASWANLNAFTAQLTVAGIDYSLYAIWALRLALEDDGTVYEAQAGLAQLLPAAVEWLRLAGPQLASLAARENSWAYGDSPGPLCRQAGITEGGFTTRRWDFWLTRLADIAAAAGETSDDAQQGLRYLLAASTSWPPHPGLRSSPVG